MFPYHCRYLILVLSLGLAVKRLKRKRTFRVEKGCGFGEYQKSHWKPHVRVATPEVKLLS